MASPLELIAGHRVADGQREEAKANGQHDDVQHFGTPSGTRSAAYGKHLLAHQCIEPDQIREPAQALIKCHLTHKHSRGIGDPQYRNLIKIGAPKKVPTMMIFTELKRPAGARR